MTIEEIYTDFLNQLKNIYDAREAVNITDWVFENIAFIKRSDKIINKQKQLKNIAIKQLNISLAALLQHKPVQYVLEEAWFYKMKFYVNEHVLIPRPETEELVEWVVNEVKSKNQKVKIIDVGTGSGCIAIALKMQLPFADIFAIDVSEDALLVAKRNAIQLNAEINFIKINFLDEADWNQLSAFDIIVSNPPYIPEKEISLLNKNVTAWEPYTALFVSDDDPFIFYRNMAFFASDHLKDKGKIFAEVHEKYAEQVSKTFTSNHFKTIIKKDIYGRDRMICAIR